MKRAIAHRPAPTPGAVVAAKLALVHDERHLRRRRLELPEGGSVLVDLPEAVALSDGNVLVCDDGSEIVVEAAPEPLCAVTGRDALHLTELAWHLGNRHLAAQIEAGRILIARDHVIRAMVEGLGGTVVDVVEPFTPVRGAYRHGHAHEHARDHLENHHRGHGHSREHG